MRVKAPDRPPKGLIAAIVLFAMPALIHPLTVGITLALDPGWAKLGGAESNSDAILSGCMDALFGAGIIAAEAPARIADRDAWADPRFALEGAAEGHEDCVIAIYAAYASSSPAPGSFLPRLVEYRLVRISDGRILLEASVAGDPAGAARASLRSAASAGKAIGLACAKKLTTVSIGGEYE